MIERDLIITVPKHDTVDVHPRGQGSSCEDLPDQGHRFFAKVNGAGFKYEICGQCGTVRISEQFTRSAGGQPK